MKYGTVVKVISGFYEGFFGYVVEKTGKNQYVVELKLIRNESSVYRREVHYDLKNLEIQSFASLD